MDRNGLTNTRTTLTNAAVRLLMWNMPFHAEHHLYPSIPFHRLPDAHATLRDRLGWSCRVATCGGTWDSWRKAMARDAGQHASAP